MPDDLRAPEIKRVQSQVHQKKRLIKKNIAKKLLVETAEQELKALHTRLSGLEAKETASDQRDDNATTTQFDPGIRQSTLLHCTGFQAA